MRDDSTETLLPSFLRVVIVSSSGVGRDVYFWTFVHPAFPLPKAASSSSFRLLWLKDAVDVRLPCTRTVYKKKGGGG